MHYPSLRGRLYFWLSVMVTILVLTAHSLEVEAATICVPPKSTFSGGQWHAAGTCLADVAAPYSINPIYQPNSPYWKFGDSGTSKTYAACHKPTNGGRWVNEVNIAGCNAEPGTWVEVIAKGTCTLPEVDNGQGICHIPPPPENHSCSSEAMGITEPFTAIFPPSTYPVGGSHFRIPLPSNVDSARTTCPVVSVPEVTFCNANFCLSEVRLMTQSEIDALPEGWEEDLPDMGGSETSSTSESEVDANGDPVTGTTTTKTSFNQFDLDPVTNEPIFQKTTTTTHPDGTSTTETTSTSTGADGSQTQTTNVTNKDVSGNPTGGTTSSTTKSDPLEGLVNAGEAQSWWDSEYPDGISDVWADVQGDLEGSPALSWMNNHTFSGSGSCPTFSADFGFGTMSLLPSSMCWIWGVIKAIFLISTAFACRRIIFGG